jgi:hypothetical protein
LVEAAKSLGARDKIIHKETEAGGPGEWKEVHAPANFNTIDPQNSDAFRRWVSTLLLALQAESRVAIKAGRTGGAQLLHFQPFVSEGQFFHRNIGALGVHRATDVFDDAGADQPPRLRNCGAIFALEMDRHVTQRALIALVHLFDPLMEIRRGDDAAFERDVAELVQPHDSVGGVPGLVAFAAFVDGEIHSSAAAFVKPSMRAVVSPTA